MKASEILRIVIPRGKADMVARVMGVSGDYVRRWMRDVPTETNDDCTGMKSPIAKTCDLIDICILDAVNSLNIFGVSEETLRSLVHLNDVLQHALSRTRVELVRISTAQSAGGAQ